MANGNKKYVWTKGKLTRIYDDVDENSSNSAEDIRFTYNAYGQRVTKTYSYDPGEDYSGDFMVGSTTSYDYDESGRLIREYCTERYYESDNITREFIYLYDESGMIGVLYSLNGATAQPYYYRRNPQGDVTEIYNQTGTKVGEYAYDAWGNFTIISGFSNDLVKNNPIRYRGYYYDRETGLYYLIARYYNPLWRRFISPDDTAYIDPENPNGLNLYAYCYNDPVNYSDPSGHIPWLISAALLFTPVGGTTLQITTSVLSYAGMAIASMFDEDIRNDMNAIGWNPFNTDESATLNSRYVSFYKGVPVFRTDLPRSGSFGAIFLRRFWVDKKGVSHKLTDPDELRHERGHNWQLMMMGVGTYGFTVGIPSPAKLGKWVKNGKYYDSPWERMADILGGVKRRTHSDIEIWNAWGYYAISTVCFPLTALYWF